MENEKPKRASRAGASISLKPSAGNSPAAQENASNPNEKLTLPSGAIAELLPFKGRHVKLAQRLANGDESQVIPAIIATATLINDDRITVEQLDDMDGRDVIKLISYYQGLF